MATRQIIPAHDPRVMVTIEVPIEGRKKPALFTAKRWEFQPEQLIEDFQEHIATTVDPETGKLREGRKADELLIDWWLDHLDLADADELKKLTIGERNQLWEIWRAESKLDLGESEAS